LDQSDLKDADEKRDDLGSQPHVCRRLVARQRERTDFGRASGFACSAQCIAAARERQNFQNSAGDIRQGGFAPCDRRASADA
jgi:hypothetical protein